MNTRMQFITRLNESIQILNSTVINGKYSAESNQCFFRGIDLLRILCTNVQSQLSTLIDVTVEEEDQFRLIIVGSIALAFARNIDKYGSISYAYQPCGLLSFLDINLAKNIVTSYDGTENFILDIGRRILDLEDKNPFLNLNILDLHNPLTLLLFNCRRPVVSPQVSNSPLYRQGLDLTDMSAKRSGDDDLDEQSNKRMRKS